MTDPKLTAGEVVELAWLTARMSKRGVAARNSPSGDVYQDDLKRKFERITDKAATRTERDARTAFNALETAENNLSAAKHAERTARGDEKRPARQARIQAQDAVRRAEREARRFR